MNSELKKWIIFLGVNIAISIAFLKIAGLVHNILNPELPPILTRINKSEDCDVVILGTSHAQVFVWQKTKSHNLVINALHQRVLNLSSSGLIGEYFFLKQFYRRGWRTKKVVYFLDPAVFYSGIWDENWDIGQPFELRYCWDASLYERSVAWLPAYIMTKFSKLWLSERPLLDDTLLEVKAEGIRSIINTLYPNGTDSLIFSKSFSNVIRILNLTKGFGAKVYFIIPPTLLGKVPGLDETIAALRELKPDYTFEVYDYSMVFSDPRLFNDYDHLNSRGSEAFCKKYLNPLLR